MRQSGRSSRGPPGAAGLAKHLAGQGGVATVRAGAERGALAVALLLPGGFAAPAPRLAAGGAPPPDAERVQRLVLPTPRAALHPDGSGVTAAGGYAARRSDASYAALRARRARLWGRGRLSDSRTARKMRMLPTDSRMMANGCSRLTGLPSTRRG